MANTAALARFGGLNILRREGMQVNMRHTMTQSKNNACFFHGSLNLKTVFDRCSHWLLAQNIVSLRSEGLDHVRMHMVLDRNDNGVSETPSNCPDRLRRSLVKLFPGFEHETTIYAVSFREARASLGPWFRNGHHLAFRRLRERIPRIGLDAEILVKVPHVY